MRNVSLLEEIIIIIIILPLCRVPTTLYTEISGYNLEESRILLGFCYTVSDNALP